jgi:hypothetical protein
VLQKGKIFSTTGEVLISSFEVKGKTSGATWQVNSYGKTGASFTLQWTFPLKIAEIISGYSKEMYRDKINLNQKSHVPLRHFNRKWVWLEVWDVAANGAFIQTIWLKQEQIILK